MVSVASALPQVKGLLEELLEGGRAEAWARQEDQVFRVRRLPPGVLLALLVWVALRGLALDGLKVAGEAVSAAAICRARSRLALGVISRAIAQVLEMGLEGRDPAEVSGGAWRGLRVVVADALTLRGCARLARRYGRAGNGQGRRRGPAQLKLAAVMDLYSGMIRPLVLLAGKAREETRKALRRLIDELGPGDLLMGDRVYGSFPVAAMALGRGAQVLLRIRDDRCAGRRYAKVLAGSADDRLVEWIRPERRPRWMSKKLWARLPESVVLREVVCRLSRRGKKTVTIRLITSLTDPTITREQLGALYQRRWEIETSFRQLKHLTGLGQLRAATPAALEREVWCAVLAYNLVRLAMVRLSRHLGVAPGRLSMIQTARVLLLGDEHLSLRINPLRPGRHAPRKLLDHRKRFPPLRPGDRKRAQKPVTLS
jgi:hypothetical protein